MSQPARSFPWPLASLPLLEIGCFAAACAVVERWPVLALVLLGLAAGALNFAVHVFFHECIHSSARRPLSRAFTWPASLAMGLPFDGYRIHHYNHHRHGNGPQDFSSTWRMTSAGRRPYSCWAYALGWPRQSVAAGMWLRRHAKAFPWSAASASRLPGQRLVLVLAFAALTSLSWKYGLLYLALVYLGWTAVALQNYGQHPPREGIEATSLDHALYNRLLFNNGLHWEHHAHPELPWSELIADERSTRIRLPHLLQPVVHPRPHPRTEVTHG